MNLFRKAWLGVRVKQILGGDMDALKAVLGWVFKLNLVPSGYVTLIGGWGLIAFYLLCLLHIQIPGMATCPENPVEALMTGLIGVGLGRRKA